MSAHGVEPNVFKTPQMRALPQIAVTTIPKKTVQARTRYVHITTGTTAVLIAFSFKRTKNPQTDYVIQPATTTYLYECPKDFQFVYVFCKTASGTSTLDVLASEVRIREV